jgi:hypothetical protein
MGREIQWLIDPDDRSKADKAVKEVIWSPRGNAAQKALLECRVFEVFFGGARGGGKTDGMLGDWIKHADGYGRNANGLMIRRTRVELVDTIERSKTIFTPLNWRYNETDKMWRSTNGARLRFAYLERDADAAQYTGHSYTRVYVEEIGNFPNPAPIMKLMATLRSGAGVPVGFRATGNPGGPGHHWVKQRYVDPAPLGNKIFVDPVTGLKRVFIPSKVDNNIYIDIEAYKQRLRASGSQELVRAWLDGDWSVTMGAFFDCWDTKKHVIEPFTIPKEWMRFRAMDWGSASPFCVQWYALVQDDYEVSREANGKNVTLPRGCMVCYREWYGMKRGEPNVGLKMHAEMVGVGIANREKEDTISYGVLDPSAFAQDGGPSIAERIASGSGGKVFFRHADNTRVAQRGAMGGWDQMRARMVGDDEGRPMIVFFSTCVDSIRTIPFLQHDPDRAEDVMTDSEDHCADTCRYACMSRPYVPHIEPPKVEDVSGYKALRTEIEPGDWRTY